MLVGDARRCAARRDDDGIRRHLCWRVPDFGGHDGEQEHPKLLPSGQPRPLTIAGGVVRWPGTLPTAGGTAEGSVNAQGVVVMHGPSGMRFDGQIDGRGTVTGRLTSYCGYQLVWQKKGK